MATKKKIRKKKPARKKVARKKPARKKVARKKPARKKVARKKPARKKVARSIGKPLFDGTVYLGKVIHIGFDNDKKVVFPLRKTGRKNPAALLTDTRGKNLYIVEYSPKNKVVRKLKKDEINQSANRITEKWTGRKIDRNFWFKNIDTESKLTKKGKVFEIAYQWSVDGKPYVHKFKKIVHLYSNERFTSLAILGESLRITKRGIEG